ncbi:MAG: glycosyltransferase [Proteobacteria bacterium]|nr:glycosyltransferase [Pseudomonadota bacterium]
MKALVIAPQPFFSPRGTPFSVYYRTLVTSELGVEVDLLTYGEGQNVDIRGVRIIRIPRFAFLGNVKVGPSILKLFLDVFMVLWTIGLLLRNRYDFVHAHEEAIFFCRFLKPIFRFKLVYDMHSSLPQQLTNFQFTTSKFLISFFKRLEDTCLHAANAIITICPDLSEYVNGLIHDKEKHFLIENSIFEPIKVLPMSSESGYGFSVPNLQEKHLEIPKSRRLVVYAGTLEPYQGIDILINAFKHVMAKNSDSFLLIVGGTKTQVEDYSALAEKCGLGPYVFFTGRVTQALAKHYCCLASVLVSPRSKGTNTPLKIYEQLASGIPLVATNIYSHTQVLSDDVAFLVEPEPNAMARGILTALQSDGDSHRIAANARQLYEQKYSRPVYEQKMRRLLGLLS